LPFAEDGILGRPSFAVNCKEPSDTGNPQRRAGKRCSASPTLLKIDWLGRFIDQAMPS
jgi:hypothetical protein